MRDDWHYYAVAVATVSDSVTSASPYIAEKLAVGFLNLLLSPSRSASYLLHLLYYSADRLCDYRQLTSLEIQAGAASAETISER